MVEFLIEIPHEQWDCSDLIRFLRAQGDLSNFEWGCQDGVHTSWAVIAADNEDEARRVVRSLMRCKARVVRVCRSDDPTITHVRKNEPGFPSPAMLHMYRTFPCWW